MNELKIPITTITFDQPFHAANLKKLRGAIIESVMKHKEAFDAADIRTDVFHNHIEKTLVAKLPNEGEHIKSENTDERYFHYPKIQYQIRHDQAGITGIGTGAEALVFWISTIGNELTVGGRSFSLTIAHEQHIQWTPALLPETNTYRLNKWLAFNPKNHECWKNTPRLTEKVTLINNILWGHVCHLLEDTGFTVCKKTLQLYISTIDHQTYMDCYGIQKLALDITFCTNLNLPSEIGLGQGTTIGYGKVQQLKIKQKRKISFRSKLKMLN